MFMNVLWNLLGAETPPNKVLERKPDDFKARDVYAREDGLMLYIPPAGFDKNKSKEFFEIVLHRPVTETSNTFSLFRSTSLSDAEMKFIVLKDKVPPFIEISKEMCNAHGLQKICDILTEHPSWTLGHLAAHFSLYDSFTNSKIQSYINSTDVETGMSPLQVAITTQNYRTVQALVGLNCSLEHSDHDLNTVFHYAATTNKDIIGILAQNAPARLVSERNKSGYTPLHMACLSDKPDCVKALLVAGADVNKTTTNNEMITIEPGYVGNFIQDHPHKLDQKDMKFGGTPLHWACSRVVIESLLEMNCYIDSVNFELKTALHVMVARNRLECVVALLSRNADANIGDCDGNRPIHIAIQEGNLPIVQALIIFGCDLDILNNRGESPRHMIKKEQESKLLFVVHAVGAKRCYPDMANCTEGCRFDGSYDGIPPPEVQGPTSRTQLDQMLAVAGMEIASKKHKNGQFPNKGRVLCLDGGGIRGLILIQMLLELESVLKQPIADCFDWFAGTSTGGILALAIATGKTMKECLCLYFRLKELTFVGIRPYPSDVLEGVLKDAFGTETVMSDIKYPKIMVTGVLADRKPVDLHLFRNYESASDMLGVVHDSPFDKPPPPQEQLIWEVARATGAAPTYFRSFGRYLDGGLIANNPTLDALTEIQEHCLALQATNREDEACPVSVVVSLGTGLIPVKPIGEIDVFIPGRVLDSLRIVGGMSALGNLLIDQATQSDGRVVDRARTWCSSIGVPYFRFSPQMSEDIAMNEKSDEKLCNMLWETKAYMYARMSNMREVADILSRH